jgi:hypothetical protein
MNQLSPDEKAKELLDKYYIEHYCWNGNGYDVDKVTTKQCQKQFALIAVEMSIEEIDNFNRHGGFQYRIDYLQEVKKEIENLTYDTN